MKSKYGRAFVANCQKGYAVTGIKSYGYDKGNNDRIYSILCCKTSDLDDLCCADTQYMNKITNDLYYNAPEMAIITGISSRFDSMRKSVLYNNSIK